MNAAPQSKLPPELAPVLGRIVGALKVVSRKQSAYSPYTVAKLDLAAQRIEAWFEQLAKSGKPSGVEELLAFLGPVDSEARRLLDGRVSFREQFTRHLEAIQTKLLRAHESRTMAPELVGAFAKRLQALRDGRAGTMVSIHSEATAIELAIDAKVSVGTEGRRLTVGANLRA